MFRSLFAGLVANLSLFAAAAATAETILVFDASNSMWGQIEGRAKVDIARDAVQRLSQTWPSSRPLGLTAYGHRREGDCADIQTLRAPGPMGAGFLDDVDALVPRGKTPLTDAVAQAAESLLSSETGVPSIILFTDGIETCGGDLCALADRLERANVNFTAHVIGFDLTTAAERASVACLADRTGGLFLAPENADELFGAFDQLSADAAVEPVEVLDANVTFEVVNSAGERVEDLAFLWNLQAAGSDRFDLLGIGPTQVAALEPGAYLIRATARGQDFDTTFTVQDANTEQLVQIAMAQGEVELIPFLDPGLTERFVGVGSWKIFRPGENRAVDREAGDDVRFLLDAGTYTAVYEVNGFEREFAFDVIADARIELPVSLGIGWLELDIPGEGRVEVATWQEETRMTRDFWSAGRTRKLLLPAGDYRLTYSFKDGPTGTLLDQSITAGATVSLRIAR